MTDPQVLRLISEVSQLRVELRRISTAELRSTVSGHTTDINTLEADVTQLETDLAAVEADLASLDHGADLAGLGDDDHPQYLNEARHDLDDHDALPEAAVTQHEAALTITESQISDLLHVGALGYAEVTSGQTGISTETDLTSLSVTVDVPANRRIRITGHCGTQQQTSTGTVVARIKESTTNLGRFGLATLAANAFYLCDGSVVLVAPSAGSHTYKLALQTTAGTVDMLADSTTTHGPAYILVEDLGPS